jgi:hypothetical protein
MESLSDWASPWVTVKSSKSSFAAAASIRSLILRKKPNMDPLMASRWRPSNKMLKTAEMTIARAIAHTPRIGVVT